MTTAIRSTLNLIQKLATILPYHISLMILPAQSKWRRTISRAFYTPPLVQKRKRRLTLPLDASNTARLRFGRRNVEQTTRQQENCPLLELPTELRLQIWQYVICGGEEGQLTMDIHPYLGSQRATLGVVSAGHQRNDGTWSWGIGVLGLLRSCRVVYSELAPLLYTTPTFSFANCHTFLAFACMILPERRAQIRYLKLKFLKAHAQSTCLEDSLDYSILGPDRALSNLPRPKKGNGEWRTVTFKWAIDEVLREMPGLKKCMSVDELCINCTGHDEEW